MKRNCYCIIMAGGIGSRFWPVSRNTCPKQFLDILGMGRTFLQQTYDRFVQIIPSNRIYVVTSVKYGALVHEQLPDVPVENILEEPMRRNTAPCIAYATYKIAQDDPTAVAVVAPSDHLIMGDKTFLDTITAAVQFASDNEVLITLGIKPTRPETGYGYIQANRKDYKTIGEHLAYPVKTFTEKPNLELAKVLMDSGEFYWNSGIFVWSLEAIAHQLAYLTPDINEPFQNGLSLYNTRHEKAYINKVYNDCRNVSIDYGVMEKATNTYVFSAAFGWSDLGSWESFYMHAPKDGDENAVVAHQSNLKGVKRCLIYSRDAKKLTVVRGLSDYIVIDMPDVLLVCPKDDAHFRELFNEVSSQNELFV